jgi:SWI/SNF-related matrix-associated actin-dependent regulator of chromatin subfamily A3
VKNASRVQIGHIPREVSRELAPLLDKKLITVEGVMHEGNIGVTHKLYNLTMSLKIYGDIKKRAQLEPQLLWATPGRRGFPARSATTSSYSTNSVASTYVNPYTSQPHAQLLAQNQARQAQVQAQAQAQALAQAKIKQERLEAFQRAEDLRQMLLTMEKVDDEGRRSSLLDNVCSKEDVLNLPQHSNPPGIASGELKVDLLKHQAQALKWCIERENPVMPQKDTDEPVQFWKLQSSNGKVSKLDLMIDCVLTLHKKYYYNIATKTPLSTNSKPLLGRGAICADAMGLGKTMTMLSLIIATKSSPTGIDHDVSQATLIVVPVSVLSNWTKQIEDHCTPGTLSVYTYHGDTRSITAQQLQQYDVVITTFNTVANENVDTTSGSQPPAKKQRTGNVLFNINWKRVILDEGHTIRNPRTKMAKGVCALSAERRWVLSGTPIINSPNDLGSLLTFLRICHPLNDPEYFKRLLLRPLKAGDPSGADLLRALMSHICIRRTKEMQDSEGRHLVPLPPVDYTVIRVTLHPAAQALYEELELLTKERIETLMHGNRAAVQSNMLSMLTRMRQAVLHPALVPTSYLEQLRSPIAPGGQGTAAPVTGEERVRLQSLLAKLIEDCEECPVCLSPLEDPRITPCAHAFCLACISGCLSKDLKCPMDRRYLDVNQLVEPPPPTELTQRPATLEEEEEDDKDSSPSAKVEQLIRLLQLAPTDEKSLVFSQFTSFLDKIEEALNEADIPFVRFDGQMSAKRREAAIKRFSIPVSGPSAERTQSEMSVNTRPRRTRSSAAFVTAVQGDDQDSGDDFVPDRAASDDDDFAVFTSSISKGKSKGKPQSIASGEEELIQDDNTNPRVMLISLKAGALGLNLTVANNVFL